MHSSHRQGIRGIPDELRLRRPQRGKSRTSRIPGGSRPPDPRFFPMGCGGLAKTPHVRFSPTCCGRPDNRWNCSVSQKELRTAASHKRRTAASHKRNCELQRLTKGTENCSVSQKELRTETSHKRNCELQRLTYSVYELQFHYETLNRSPGTASHN